MSSDLSEGGVDVQMGSDDVLCFRSLRFELDFTRSWEVALKSVEGANALLNISKCEFWAAGKVFEGFLMYLSEEYTVAMLFEEPRMRQMEVLRELVRGLIDYNEDGFLYKAFVLYHGVRIGIYKLGVFIPFSAMYYA